MKLWQPLFCFASHCWSPCWIGETQTDFRRTISFVSYYEFLNEASHDRAPNNPSLRGERAKPPNMARLRYLTTSVTARGHPVEL